MYNNYQTPVYSNVSSSSSPLGFFFLCVYTLLAFVRPHEWPIFATELLLLRGVLIFTFFAYLISVRPKAWNFQCTLMLLLTLFMVLSELRGGRGLSDLARVQAWVISAILPFILYVGFLSSIKRQLLVFYLSMFACLIMVYNGYIQINSPLGESWASSSIYRSDSANNEQQIRYVGIFEDPNDLGMFLLMHVPIAILLFVRSQARLMKIVSLVVLALLCIGLYWTKSRGSLLGFLVVLLCLFYLKFGKTKSLVLGALIIPLIIGALGFRSVSTNDDSAQDRITAWLEGVEMWEYRPVLGFGKGRFQEFHYKVAHNSYITVMAELGTIGFILWMMFILLIFYYGIKLLKLDSKLEKKGLEIEKEQQIMRYLLISVLAFCSTAFFISRSYSLFFYIFAGMVFASYLRATKLSETLTYKVSLGIIFKLFIFSVITLIVLLFVVKLLAKL